MGEPRTLFSAQLVRRGAWARSGCSGASESIALPTEPSHSAAQPRGDADALSGGAWAARPGVGGACGGHAPRRRAREGPRRSM